MFDVTRTKFCYINYFTVDAQMNVDENSVSFLFFFCISILFASMFDSKPGNIKLILIDNSLSRDIIPGGG